MKIFIFTKGRAETIRTHKFLPENSYFVVLHTDKDLIEYAKNITLLPDAFLVTGIENGLAQQRIEIEKQIEVGEWYLKLDDNIECFTAVDDNYYYQEKHDVENMPRETQKLWNKKIDYERFMEICEESIEKAEAIGAHLIGFANTDNYYWRGTKWRSPAFAIGKAQLVKKGKAKSIPGFSAREDYQITAENILRYGECLVNSLVKPKAGHFEAGGIGTKEKRFKMMQKESKMLMKLYPDLFRFNNNKKEYPKNCEILMKIRTKEQAKKWRIKMFNLGRI